MSKTKHVTKSKTMIFNFVTGLLALAPLLGFNFNLTPEQVTAIVNVAVVAVPVINMYLRSITKDAVHVKN